jgi:hypothetical protein
MTHRPGERPLLQRLSDLITSRLVQRNNLEDALRGLTDLAEWMGFDTGVPPAPTLGALVGGQSAAQETWFIDNAAGDDDADGLTAETAIATFEEWSRRVGPEINVAMTINVVGTYTGDIAIAKSTKFFPAGLTIQGQRTEIYSGTIDATTPWGDGTPATLGTITSNGLPSSWTALGLGNVIVLADRPMFFYSPSWAWGAIDQGGKTLVHSPFYNFSGYDDPIVGEAVKVYSLTRIDGTLSINGTGNVSLLDLDIRPTDPNKSGLIFDRSTGFVLGCNLGGFDSSVSNASPVVQYLACRCPSRIRVSASSQLIVDCSLFTLQAQASRGGEFACVYPNVFVGVTLNALSGGKVSTYPGLFAAILNVGTGIEVGAMSVGEFLGPVWGTGITALGARVDPAGALLYGAAYPIALDDPAIDLDIGGSLMSYADLVSAGGQYMNPNNGAVIAPSA